MAILPPIGSSGQGERVRLVGIEGQLDLATEPAQGQVQADVVGRRATVVRLALDEEQRRFDPMGQPERRLLPDAPAPGVGQPAPDGGAGGGDGGGGAGGGGGGEPADMLGPQLAASGTP